MMFVERRGKRIALLLLTVFAASCSGDAGVAPLMTEAGETFAEVSGDLEFHFPDLRPSMKSTISVVQSGPVNVVEPECGTPESPPCEEGPLSDEDYAAVMLAEVITPMSASTLTENLASAWGRHSYTGTSTRIETKLDLYFDGDYRAHWSDDTDRTMSVLDWLNAGTGYCTSTTEIVNGQLTRCPQTIQTDPDPITLGQSCGHNIVVQSVHTAKMIIGGFQWDDDKATTNANKSQQSCQPDDPPGGGPPGPYECTEYTCSIWYWVDTGEVIFMDCYCSRWDE